MSKQGPGWTIGVQGFDSWRGVGNFSLHHRVQNGSGAHSASYPMGTRCSFPGSKASGAWSSPLTSILCRGQRMSGAVPPLPQYAFMAWCQLKYGDNFTFTFTFTKQGQMNTGFIFRPHRASWYGHHLDPAFSEPNTHMGHNFPLIREWGKWATNDPHKRWISRNKIHATSHSHTDPQGSTEFTDDRTGYVSGNCTLTRIVTCCNLIVRLHVEPT
jgi:hypothetical protein